MKNTEPIYIFVQIFNPFAYYVFCALYATYISYIRTHVRRVNTEMKIENMLSRWGHTILESGIYS